MYLRRSSLSGLWITVGLGLVKKAESYLNLYLICPPSQKLTADKKRKLKRNLLNLGHEPYEISSRPFSRQITKRVCRNLTAEFCSVTSDGSACSEPNLDLWVLQTLGLKDQNTIDMSSETQSEYSFRDLVYDGGIAPLLAAEPRTDSSFSSPATVSTPSSVHSYCPTPTGEMDYRFSGGSYPAMSAQMCSGSPRNITAVVLNEPYASSEIRSIGGVRRLETSPETSSTDWYPHPASWTPPEQLSFNSRSSSSSLLSKSPAPSSGCHPTGQPDSSQLPGSAQPRHKPTDLAFSMSLSPSSSVKTHSFPQGQAFIRKDTGGRWNFTWVPRQEP